MTNTGALNITTLPLQLAYDTVDLDFYPADLAVTPIDAIDDGSLNWHDLTDTLGDLIPNIPVTFMVQFTAIQDTTSSPATAPCNIVGESCLSIEVVSAQDSSGTLPTATANDAIDIELGLQNKYILGDFVWQDQSKDGLKDQGEDGINGVKVNLYLDGSDGSTLNGTPEAGEFLLSTMTANNPNSPEIAQDGYYSFSVVTGPGKIYIIEIDQSNFEPGNALAGMVDTGQQNQNRQLATSAALNLTEVVVPMTSDGDYLDADFGFAATAANVALDVALNTAGPARQSEPISFTVTITNLDAAPLTSLPVRAEFGQVYLDCTTATQTPDTVDNNVLGWNDLLATAGNITLNQNQVIAFDVFCIAGLDTTLLPNQQAALLATAANAADSDGISIFAPTAVFMAERGLQVDRATGQVTLMWSTADESQIVAFNVYRRWADNSVWTRLNRTAIAAKRTGQSAGNSYTFSAQLDPVTAANANGNFRNAHYRLGLLMTNSSDQFLDLGSTAPVQTNGIFLPMVAR